MPNSQRTASIEQARECVYDMARASLRDAVFCDQLLEHVIGTHRSFGTRFWDFFGEPASRGCQRLIEEQDAIVRIYLMARAFLIADDALQDGDYRWVQRERLAELRTAMLSSIFKEGDQLLGETECKAIVDSRISMSENAYNSDWTAKPPTVEFAKQRCAMFFLAFDFMRRLARSEDAIRLSESLFARALCLLQIADDFSDLNDDLTKPRHANLIGWQHGSERTYLDSITSERSLAYAGVAIVGTAHTIIEAASPQSAIERWAKAIASRFRILGSSDLSELIAELFGELPHGMCPMLTNPNHKLLSGVAVEFCGLNGVVVSAESLNIYATIRALGLDE